MTNFDISVNRRGTNSYKWDSAPEEGILPLWVADMDFRTAPAVTEALRKRVEHGVFGYTHVPDTFYEATINWFGQRHNWQIEREWMLYTSGVVPAISAVIKGLTTPGDKVLVQTPVYNCFFSSIRNNGCLMEENRLVYEDCYYRIDFEDFERKAADPAVKLFLLCNPHNPAGRVWTAEELRCMGEICRRHGVIVVSDEIHGEFTFPGYTYVPFASASATCLHNSVTCTSPSKAFNTAGLQIANIICDNAAWRQKIDRAINDNEVCDVNPFGIEGLIAAYTEGGEWLDELKAYLFGNYNFLCRYFEEHLPDFPVLRMEGTYLAWVDCRCLRLTSAEVEEQLLGQEKVWVNAGSMYGEAGEGFIRINMACPRSSLTEGLQRIERGLQRLKNI